MSSSAANCPSLGRTVVLIILWSQFQFLLLATVVRSTQGEKDGFVVGVPNSVTSGVYNMHMVKGAEVEVTT